MFPIANCQLPIGVLFYLTSKREQIAFHTRKVKPKLAIGIENWQCFKSAIGNRQSEIT
jgi:hypothetical protein